MPSSLLRYPIRVRSPIAPKRRRRRRRLSPVSASWALLGALFWLVGWLAYVLVESLLVVTICIVGGALSLLAVVISEVVGDRLATTSTTYHRPAPAPHSRAKGAPRASPGPAPVKAARQRPARAPDRPRKRPKCSARCRASAQPVSRCRCSCGGSSHGSERTVKG